MADKETREIWFKKLLESLDITQMNHTFNNKDIDKIDLTNPIFDMVQSVKLKTTKTWNKMSQEFYVTHMIKTDDENIEIGNTLCKSSYIVNLDLVSDEHEEYKQFLDKFDNFIVKNFIVENFMRHFSLMAEIKTIPEFASDFYKYGFEQENNLDKNMVLSQMDTFVEIMKTLLNTLPPNYSIPNLEDEDTNIDTDVDDYDSFDDTDDTFESFDDLEDEFDELENDILDELSQDKFFEKENDKDNDN